jgi:hypothetical protein
MAPKLQDRYVTDADAGANLASPTQLPAPHYVPSPLSATSPGFPRSFMAATSANKGNYPLISPITDAFSSPSKGKGKRPVSDTSPPLISYKDTLPRLHKPPHITVLSRQRHRRRNVAATVWGPQLPMAPHKLPGLPFNVYKALLRHPNLFFQFAIRLDTEILTELYAIDKEFHFRFNKYSISIIAEHASYHAHEAAYIFSWVLLPDLCISDPMLRPMDGRPHLARDIPSLRWVKMVVHRDSIVRGILTDLGEHGLRVPAGTKVALMKFWLLMEMKRMNLRTAFLSDKKVWTDDELLYLLHFVVKLDMRILHPVFGNGMCALSHMMLTQKTLTELHDLLKSNGDFDYDDGSLMIVKTYPAEDLDIDTHTWLEDEVDNGVPFEQHGMMCREDWHMDGDRLEPALDMVVVEATRRGLQPQRYLLEWTLYGFVDQDTMTNIPAPRKWRHEKAIHVPRETWPRETERKAVIDKLDKKVGVEGMKTKMDKPLIRVMKNREDGSGIELFGLAVDMTG